MDWQFIGSMLAGVLWNSTVPIIFGYLGGLVLLSSFLLPLFWPNWKEWSGKMMKSEKARRWMKRGVITGGIILIFLGLIFSASGIYKNKMIEQEQIIADLKGNITSLSNQIGLLNNELATAEQRNFALPSELLASRLSGLEIRLADLALFDPIIKNKIFEDCDFYGPSIIMLGNNTVMRDCVFEGPSSQWLISSTNESLIGAMKFENCIITNCHFWHIGIISTPEGIANLRLKVTNE